VHQLVEIFELMDQLTKHTVSSGERSVMPRRFKYLESLTRLAPDLLNRQRHQSEHKHLLEQEEISFLLNCYNDLTEQIDYQRQK